MPSGRLLLPGLATLALACPASLERPPPPVVVVAGGSGGAGGAAGGGDAGGGDGGTGGEGGGAGCLPGPPDACDASDVYAVAASTAEPFCLGAVIACGEAPPRSLAEVQALMPPGLTATTGYTSRRLSYRTRRRDGSPAVASARLFLPDAITPGAPLVVANHGTVGLADACAPSKTEEGGDPNLVVPWAGTGLPVIAVDYAGLGTEGVQGYGDWEDTAYGVLDGARAALALLGEDRPVALLGHSQGGGASLAALSLAGAYTPELTVERTVAYAGVNTTFVLITPDNADTVAELPLDLASRSLFSLVLYADFYALFGPDRAGEVFASSARETIVDGIESLCLDELGPALDTAEGTYTPPGTIGELFDGAFLAAAIACVKGTTGCTADAQTWVDFRNENVPLATDGGPLLYLGAENDTLHAPAIYACTLEGLTATGIALETCFLADADHVSILPKGAPAVRPWLTGAPLSCPPQATPPPCE